jgi:hypothetical protein
MVIFENKQWQVTADELRTHPNFPTYPIETARLTKTTTRGGQSYYDWPIQMAQKSWVDANQFNEAFGVAIRAFARTSESVWDEAMLSRSFAYATSAP